jgi:hypothetical protein
MRILSALSTFALLATPLLAQDVGRLEEDARNKLRDELRPVAQKLARKPLPELIRLLGEHDVLLLGEVHGVRQTTSFVAAALPELYHKAKLRLFATEFLRQSLSQEANRILQADEWDREAMIGLMRRGPWPTWGYAGYLEIYHSIWQLNHALPEDAEPLRLVGMDSEWSQYEQWFGKLSRRERFQQNLDREKTMIAAVKQGGIGSKTAKKTLVHVGFAHTVTCQGIRLGTVLHKEYPGRLVQVVLHHALRNRQREMPVTELLEELFEKLEKEGVEAPALLPIHETALAKLKDSNWPFARALPHGTLGDLAQHWLFLAPVDEQLPQEWISGFITETMFPQAMPVAVRMRYVQEGECKNAQELDAKLAAHFAQLAKSPKRR